MSPYQKRHQHLTPDTTDRGEHARLVAVGRRAGMSATMLGQALSKHESTATR